MRNPLPKYFHCVPSLGLSFFAASAHAGPSEEGFHGFLGAGAAYRADYDGAKERRALALPVSMLSYRKGAFDISTSEGLRYWAVNNPDWQVALVLGADFGRSERKTRFGLGSERLVGMGSLRQRQRLASAPRGQAQACR